jgi:hypothetical protein
MEADMIHSRTDLIKAALLAAVAAGSLVAASAKADSYVVCNRWDECWRVHERYTTYPPDVQITVHDDAWRESHEHDTHFRWLTPPDDRGWYDRDGNWHAFAASELPPPAPPPPPRPE